LAAEQGNAAAQLNLGSSYANGEGVDRDYVQAHMWFALAASRGNEQAEEHRDKISKLMTPAQIADAQKMAGEWKPRTEAAK
jgi:TPR repeat protein